MVKGTQFEFAIYRVDDARHLVHGWMVKVSRRKVPYRQLFSDAACHGRDGALAAARAFRDGVIGRRMLSR